MFINYFLIVLRHIVRNRLHSIINIAGFSLGLAACFLIFLFVSYQTSYDKWLPNSQNIFRVNYFGTIGDTSVATSRTPGVAKAPLVDRFAEIEEATRFYYMNPLVESGDKAFKEDIWMADLNFLEVIELPFVIGDRQTAFSSLSNIVISESIAEKFFGNAAPLGRVLSFRHQGLQRSYQVSGIFRDLPRNSEFDFKIIFPLDDNLHANSPGINQGWFRTRGQLYLKLKPGSDIDSINDQLPDLVAQHLPPKPSADAPNRTVELQVQNIRDIHLYSDNHPFGPIQGIKPIGDITQVYAFGTISILILIIACVNFVNLSTARSMRRAKEVGLRKVVGASRLELVKQFLTENMIIVSVSLFVAFVIVDLLLPVFNQTLALSLSLETVSLSSLIFAILGLLLLIGSAAGLYPALYLSAFQPAKVLTSSGGQSTFPLTSVRAALTIFQFTVSIALIIATSVVAAQNFYSINKDLGFSKENKIVIRQIYEPRAFENRAAITDAILKLPDVEAVSYSTLPPTDRIGWVQNMSVAGRTDATEVALSSISIDPNYLSVYDIPILHGRNLDWARPKDLFIDKKPEVGNLMPIGSALINQSAMRLFGFKGPQDALGQILHQTRGNLGVRRMEIVGIVPDYHYDSAREPIRPLVYNYWPDFFWNLTVKYRDDTDVAGLQNQLKAVWNTYVPSVAYNGESMESLVARQYSSEIKQSKILFIFAAFAILISCLGLYGLAAFTAEKRMREIAIRKVHGAYVWDIAKLLLAQFSKPVLIANVIAWPIAWYFMNDYLSGFVFRIDLTFSYFIGTGLTALLIAWATTVIQIVKVARTNPVHALQSE